jgi:hypothetical protein
MGEERCESTLPKELDCTWNLVRDDLETNFKSVKYLDCVEVGGVLHDKYNCIIEEGESLLYMLITSVAFIPTDCWHHIRMSSAQAERFH